MRIIIYIILIFLLYRIAKALLFPQKPSVKQKNEPVLRGDETAFDPICQSYFPKTEALTVRNGNEVTYFCSEECREKFLKTMRS